MQPWGCTKAYHDSQPIGCQLVSEGIERNVRLPAPPKRVWEALTEEDQLSAWIGWDAEIDAHPGGAVRFGAAGGTRMRGIVSDLPAYVLDALGEGRVGHKRLFCHTASKTRCFPTS